MTARPITAALVDEVWREITQYASDRAEAEARAFLEQQPDVASLSAMSAEGLEGPGQQATFGLAFLFFKVLERSVGAPVPRISEERLRKAWEGNIERLTGLPENVTSGLVACVMTVFYGGDGGAADGRVRAALVLLLQTLTEATDVGSEL